MSDDDFNEDDLDLVYAVNGSKLTVKNDLAERHSTTVSASNAHKIMTKLDLIGVLPDTGKRYIESMVKACNAYFKSEQVTTKAIAHGIDNELPAIVVLEKTMGIKLIHIGQEQKRFFYNDFVSALPDGIDEFNQPFDIKCLNTDNHIIACGWTEKELMDNDWAKYCQSQTQMLCTGADIGFMVFYDPRHNQKLHIVEIKKSTKWQKQFLNRVELAKAYYFELLNSEPSKELAPIVIAPNSELVKECLFYKDSNGNYKTRSRQEAVKFTKEWLDRDLASQIDFNLVCDLSNPNNIKDFKKRAADIQKFKKPLITASSALADDAKKVKDTDVGVRQTIESVIDSYAELIVKPIKEKEDNEKRIAKEKQDAIDAENERLAGIELAKKARDVEVANEINKLRELPAKCKKYASVALESEIKTIKLLSFKPDFFGERLAEASDAKDVVIMKLENMLKTAIHAENQRAAEQLESQRIEKVNNLFYRLDNVIGEMKGKSASELQDKIKQIDAAVLDKSVLGVRYNEATAKKDDVLNQLKAMLESEPDKECDIEWSGFKNYFQLVIENDAIVDLDVKSPVIEKIDIDSIKSPFEQVNNDIIDLLVNKCDGELDMETIKSIAWIVSLAIKSGKIPHVSFNP